MAARPDGRGASKDVQPEWVVFILFFRVSPVRATSFFDQIVIFGGIARIVASSGAVGTLLVVARGEGGDGSGC